MHGHDPQFAVKVANFLGPYFFTLAVVNALCALWLWQREKRPLLATAATALAGLFIILSSFTWSRWLGYFLGPDGFLHGAWVSYQNLVNSLLTGNRGAIVYTVGTAVLLLVLYWKRRFFVKPIVAWIMMNAAFLLMGVSMYSEPFWDIVAKPDNVPIVMLVFLLGFFTWLAAYKSVQNDDRLKEGKPPLESEDNEKVLVWPDLVYTELICMVALTAILIVWAIVIQAPLEEPASAVKTPNPSKAPWYFLGLQEMLVYYDPWMAGVVLPSLVIFGLMAIPYIDFNKKGNGYFTIEERPFAYIVFQVGFLELWITLIVLGTFLRGPNWNFFGPYEVWDPHKVLALNNVNLSDWLWVEVMGSSLPKVTSGMGFGEQVMVIFKREWLGIILVLGYFLALPPLLAVTVLRGFFLRMGFLRFMVLANLLLFMAALPLKMVLRWAFNLKYVVAIPEFFLNF